jgi:HSP20 family molecular chaperone IbpA
MEENQKIKEEMSSMCSRHPLMKTLFIGFLIFLGAYCAFYVVADWHFKRMLDAQFMNPARMEHMMRKDMRKMDKLMRENKMFSEKSANVIHIEQSRDFYKIIIDLRAFENNENNVKVSENGNILTINGRTVKKSKNDEQISEFQQQFMFGNNVKLNEITKETEGNFYVITIPINKEGD